MYVRKHMDLIIMYVIGIDVHLYTCMGVSSMHSDSMMLCIQTISYVVLQINGSGLAREGPDQAPPPPSWGRRSPAWSERIWQSQTPEDRDQEQLHSPCRNTYHYTLYFIIDTRYASIIS